jgi:hypothetical protein
LRLSPTNRKGLKYKLTSWLTIVTTDECFSTLVYKPGHQAFKVSEAQDSHLFRLLGIYDGQNDRVEPLHDNPGIISRKPSLWPSLNWNSICPFCPVAFFYLRTCESTGIGDVLELFAFSCLEEEGRERKW